MRSRVGTKILETLKPVSSNSNASTSLAKALFAWSSAAKRSAVARACFEKGEKFSSTFLIDPKSFSEIISQRRKDFESLSSLEEPFIVNGPVPPVSEWTQKTNSVEPVQVGEIMTGLSGSPGEITARARVITDPGDPRGIEQGEILVAPITAPAWTPLFIPAGGVVVDVGAPMSHSVIVSREFGIPCVVSVHQAAERIPDGALIQVDGNNGTVTIIELP